VVTDFDALDALLASVRPEAALPPADERRALREALALSQTQIAQALGVSPSTVRGWESGREPAGEVRTKYAYLLDGLRTKLHPPAGGGAGAEAVGEGAGERVEGGGVERGDQDGEGEVVGLAAPAPCVLRGQPAVQEVEGFPQHLTPEECAEAHTPESTPAPSRPRRPAPQKATESAHRAFQEPSDVPDLIGRAVRTAMEQAQGDMEAASAALLKRAIPDAMALLDACRKGARYDIIAHPWIPDVLKKKTARADIDRTGIRPFDPSDRARATNHPRRDECPGGSAGERSGVHRRSPVRGA
jgi:DNA-binding XRE family transcriptional regulator